MSSNSDDIQAAGSDTRPPMLDRTDYESWSQRIRLYCRGKENGLQILQSIDQGPFELGTTRDALGTTPEGGVLLGPERPRTYEDLSDTKRRNDTVSCLQYVLQGYPKDIYKSHQSSNIEAKAFGTRAQPLPPDNYQLRTHTTPKSSNIQDGRVVVSGISRAKNQNQRYFAGGNWYNRNGVHSIGSRIANVKVKGNQSSVMIINGVGHIARNVLSQRRHRILIITGQRCCEQAKENEQLLDEEELLFLAGEQGNTFDADSILHGNLSSVGSANPQAGPSNASILSEVHILENAIDHSVSNQDEHEIHNKVQPSNVIDSTSVHMGNSNVIPYEQYVSVNDISVVPSCASSALNSVCVSPVNDAVVPHDSIKPLT
ncbi:hypothetical protein Tco_1253796 [Tanacetum coccineum]